MSNRVWMFPSIKTFRELGRVGRGVQTQIVSLAAVLSVTMLASAVGMGLLVSASARSSRPMLFAGLVVLGTSFIAGSLWEFLEVAATKLTLRIRESAQRAILEASLKPLGIAHLEDPELATEVDGAREQWMGGTNLGRALPAMTAVRIHAFAAMVAIGVVFLPGVPLFVVARAAMRKWLSDEVDVSDEHPHSVDNHRARYFRDLCLGRGAAKELRLFGLRDFALSRYLAHSHAALQITKNKRGSMRVRAVALFAATTASIGILVWGITAAVLRGAADIGFAVAAVELGMQALLMGGGDEEVEVARGGAMLRRAFSLLARTRAAGDVVSGDADLGEQAVSGVSFKRVTFRYGSDGEPVLNDLSLTLRSGECLAIVGANGAGKTTLVKLLMRLYDSNDGRISVDNVEIGSLDVRAWRRRLAVLTQDACHFDAPLAYNVGLGRASDAEVRDALVEAGAGDLIETVGLNTMCSPSYEGGVDLSGGQWQKVSLARVICACRAGADVVIMDEPTASLDAVAEARFFDTFAEVTRGRISVIISHRFSTVRCADRIAVLEGGRVSELGTHDDLIARRGTYAAMFETQAKPFAPLAEAV